mmetsp:Transcript_18192/g.47420  ORF Transcript_18192/g.47420 Transcript_18192/m.47420 type:complete len:476 (+) Transcript_18192:84-1511(+)
MLFLTYMFALGLPAMVVAALAGLAVLLRRSAARSASAAEVAAAKSIGGTTVGFFHPYCNAGGGGERVLWCAVQALCEQSVDIHCVVYTGDIDASKAQILDTAQSRFGLGIDPARVTFVFLRRRGLVEAARYPHFTMLGQSLGSMVLGWEALSQVVPEVFIDSMGYAFVLPIARWLAGCRVGCYVHYPTISTDMLSRVQNREGSFNNSEAVSRSSTLTTAKLLYYRLFAALYGMVGGCAEVVLTNSSWTHNHIVTLWGRANRTSIVYPPCNTADLEANPLEGRLAKVVSVAQFRPEKNHALQLQAFARFVSEYPVHASKVELVMVGGCRNSGDQARVAALEALLAKLNLKHCAKIVTNAPYPELKRHLREAAVGIHTMRDEHFGIGVVEFMAAGAIPLAHNSAGPRMDIVTPAADGDTGFLAATEEEYTEALAQVFAMIPADRLAMQRRARQAVKHRFSDEAFREAFLAAVAPLLV